MAAIEILYPEFGNQAGDNGNAMYLEKCVEGEAEVIRTDFLSEPAFATRDDVRAILMDSLTEAHQRLVVERLRPYAARLAELADAGVMILFTHSAAELLGTSFETPAGEKVDGLGLLDFTVRNEMPTRHICTNLGTFDPGNGEKPIRLVGYRIQFTQVDGDNEGREFCRLDRGFGLRDGSALEGWRRGGLMTTWMLGPVLIDNPDLTRWFLRQALGRDVEPAFADLADAAYARRLAELSAPLPRGKEIVC